MAAKDPPAPEDDELAQLIMRWIHCSMQINRSREGFRVPTDAGITIPMMHALTMLFTEGTASVSAVTERLEMSVSAVSHMVQRLVEMGFVSRTESEADRRQKNVSLSGQGKKIVDKMMRARFEDMRRSVERLSPPLKKDLHAVLQRVVDEMGAHVAVAQGARARAQADAWGKDLAGKNLEGADLSGAELTGADLRGANLKAASFAKATCGGADFSGANLARAELSDALLQGARFNGANLEGAALVRCNLEGATFVGANLEGANLDASNLADARFKAANLEGARLRGARLDGADFDHAHVERADFDGANVNAARNLYVARRKRRASEPEEQ